MDRYLTIPRNFRSFAELSQCKIAKVFVKNTSIAFWPTVTQLRSFDYYIVKYLKSNIYHLNCITSWQPYQMRNKIHCQNTILANGGNSLRDVEKRYFLAIRPLHFMIILTFRLFSERGSRYLWPEFQGRLQDFRGLTYIDRREEGEGGFHGHHNWNDILLFPFCLFFDCCGELQCPFSSNSENPGGGAPLTPPPWIRPWELYLICLDNT